MSPEKTIEDARVVKNFLDNDVVKAALARVSVRYYEEFRRADSSEKRVTAWARANALEDVLTELQAVKDAGEREVLIAERSAPKPKEK